MPRQLRRPNPTPGALGGLVLLVGIASSWLAPATLQAELMTVGNTANGCTHPNLLSAMIRADITPEDDTILIAENQIWTGTLPLTLSNESDVVIEGIFGCANLARLVRRITTTRGDLFDFRDTDFTLRSLHLRSENLGGRLLRVEGSMLLTLENVIVDNGRADFGANIQVTGGASMLALDGVQIIRGLASSLGGGIFCTGTGTVALLQGSRVHDNASENRGGGIYTAGCAINVLSGGPRSPTGFYGVTDNVANISGGGIYAANGSDIIIAGTAATTATLYGNEARDFGGGLYVTGTASQIRIENAEINDNRTQMLGGGLYVSAGATLLMERSVGACSRGPRCSLMDSNYAGSPTLGPPAFGGAIAVVSGGRAEIRQTFITGSIADNDGQVALVEGVGSRLLIEGSVLYDNHVRGRHVLAREDGEAHLAFVSAWGSSIPGFRMDFLGGESGATVRLDSSIVIEGNGLATEGGGTDRVFDSPGNGVTYSSTCVTAHETDSLGPSSSHIRITDPALVWQFPSSGDPRLAWTSPAIDHCNTAFYDPQDDDIDGQVRGVDLPVANSFGTFDVGADELYLPTGLLHWDGFEAGHVLSWSSATP